MREIFKGAAKNSQKIPELKKNVRKNFQKYFCAPNIFRYISGPRKKFGKNFRKILQSKKN